MVVFASKPGYRPSPGEGVEIAERRFGHAMLKVVGPSPQERVDPLQEGGERQVLRSLRQRPHPTADSQDGFLGRVRIDVALASASLLLLSLIHISEPTRL